MARRHACGDCARYGHPFGVCKARSPDSVWWAVRRSLTTSSKQEASGFDPEAIHYSKTGGVDHQGISMTDLRRTVTAASRMRALQRGTSLFVTEAVVERGIRMLDKQ
ncbi:MAG: hypothetical protein J07HQW1_01365 [Haloquadratum walsbyi J07HQW1]|uniref:Uncharacterized protein n=1 Tax=Haloquadratum walsbyi J07HQW1 TaxID=1238424 RepID=U1PGS6_9EURY|nr:MAG: hypothetical protein J07HQW1_01365 [Haloquadratum walsbyi J07HQW1]